MRVWHLYLVSRRWPWWDTVVRAYAAGSEPPRRWRPRFLGVLPAPTRRMAEVLAVVVGWTMPADEIRAAAERVLADPPLCRCDKPRCRFASAVAVARAWVEEHTAPVPSDEADMRAAETYSMKIYKERENDPDYKHRKWYGMDVDAAFVAGAKYARAALGIPTPGAGT